MASYYTTHQPLLAQAARALRERTYWSAFAENPADPGYGPDAMARGAQAFAALLGRPFAPDIAGPRVGAEMSPFGPALDITYPQATVPQIVAASMRAARSWAAAEPGERVGIALELLQRLNRHSHLIAHAVHHTTGQPLAMAFQAGGPHAQDRALEAITLADEEMDRIPPEARWTRPAGRGTVTLRKTFRIIPRGIGLVIGCATFPTWNAYPGLFASLVTGNSVVVKPHPLAILPLAITVGLARDLLAEAGYDPDVVILAPDTVERPITRDLALDPAVAIIDYTGSGEFGGWLRAEARHAQLHTEEAGVNPIVVHSTGDYRGMCQNIALSLSLYSGQMCTAPQNVYIPAGGIATDQGHQTAEAVMAAIAAAIDGLLADPGRALGILGAIQNPGTLQRIADARGLGRILRDSAPVPGTDARTATPLLIATTADDPACAVERFGPIAFLLTAESGTAAIEQAAAVARRRGAISAGVYTTDPALADLAADRFGAAGVGLSLNLTGPVLVNQNAAFSDFHVSGMNPAGNACLTDAAFVAGRFRVAARREPAPA